jgi:hypothetical protein
MPARRATMPATLLCGERLVNMAKITLHIREARKNMITAAQCRSARALLSWSLGKLASAASVPTNVIDDFELEGQQPDAPVLAAIQRAFEDVGVEFLPGDDVRLRTAASPVE